MLTMLHLNSGPGHGEIEGSISHSQPILKAEEDSNLEK